MVDAGDHAADCAKGKGDVKRVQALSRLSLDALSFVVLAVPLKVEHHRFVRTKPVIVIERIAPNANALAQNLRELNSRHLCSEMSVSMTALLAR